MAKPNYRQQKRQKELSRKSRQAERLQRRTGKLEGDEVAGDASVPVAGEIGLVPGAPAAQSPSTLPAPAPKATP